MAHFAQLDEQNTVTQVIVVHDNECQVNGIENEDAGIAFCRSLFGLNTNWKQTSYNGNIRKNYAGIGFVYDSTRDAFISPKPFASWVLNETSCDWDAPTPMPTDGKFYRWNEQQLAWVETT
jgi:hypothetical protein